MTEHLDFMADWLLLNCIISEKLFLTPASHILGLG